MKHRLSILTVGALVALVAAAIAFGQGSSSPQPSASSGATAAADCPTPPQGVDHAAQSPAAAVLAIFRRPRTNCDALPTNTGQGRLVEDDGVRADAPSARRVQTTPTEVNWVIPGAGEEKGGVCLLGDNFMNCPGADIVVDRGVAPSIVARGDNIRVQGIAADAVSSVEITLEGGDTLTASVRENTFTVRTTKWPLEIRWQGPHGTERQPFPPRQPPGT